MTTWRRRPVAALLASTLVLGVAPSALALHNGATVDCGDAGTFHIEAQPNGAGFEAPPPGDAIQFAEGGRLALLALTIDGVVVFDTTSVGRAHNALDEVTCTFSLANGVPFEVTGLLVATTSRRP